MNEKKLNVNINDGEEFFAQEASISYNPTLFNLDFRRITSRVDMRSNEANVLVLRHNVIMLEPHVMKKMIEIMTRAIEKYEKEFGVIETPESVKKLEEKVKKQVQLQTKDQNTELDYVGPNYFG